MECGSSRPIAAGSEWHHPTATPDPPDDPPVLQVVSHGLSAGRVCLTSVGQVKRCWFADNVAPLASQRFTISVVNVAERSSTIYCHCWWAAFQCGV
jgi:hypothetical protein